MASSGGGELGLQFAHSDPLDRGAAVLGTDDIGDMAKHLPDDIDRLQGNAMVGDDGEVAGQFVAHLDEHRSGKVEFGRKAQVEGCGDADHGLDLEALSLKRRKEQFGNGLGDGIAVQAVSGVEVGEIAGLAEAIDAKRRDSLTEDTAKP